MCKKEHKAIFRDLLRVVCVIWIISFNHLTRGSGNYRSNQCGKLRLRTLCLSAIMLHSLLGFKVKSASILNRVQYYFSHLEVSAWFKVEGLYILISIYYLHEAPTKVARKIITKSHKLCCLVPGL